jgi:hypothetical protein
MILESLVIDGIVDWRLRGRSGGTCHAALPSPITNQQSPITNESTIKDRQI